MRDRTVIEAEPRTETGKNVARRLRQSGHIPAILYGAGHMPDMARRLTEQLGYRPTGEQWLTAFEVDLERSAMSARQLERIRWMVRYQLEQLKSQQNPES